jgi:4'-phosphopantetheinyl transferase
MSHLSASGRLPLAGIDVWRVATAAFSAADDAWHRDLLDKEELRRAVRLRRLDDRLRFEGGRASLQMLLKHYLGSGGGRTAIEAGVSGKLHLAHAGQALTFNSSHSGDWILHAFADSVSVGIDVEKLDERISRGIDDYLAALAPEEHAALEQCPSASRPFQFVQCWVRKEAYLKAIGEGLRRSPELVSIGRAADGRVRLLYDRNSAEPAGPWNFVDLGIDDRHLGCVAYPGPERPVRVRDDAAWRRVRSNGF